MCPFTHVTANFVTPGVETGDPLTDQGAQDLISLLQNRPHPLTLTSQMLHMAKTSQLAQAGE